MNTASSLYRELSSDELMALSDKHFGSGALKDARLMKGGLFNTTYLLTLKGGDRCVLRLGPVNRHLLMVFEQDMMAAEARVDELGRAAGVPMPQVIAVDDKKILVDRDYMITAYIDAPALNTLEVTPEEDLTLREEVGALTKRLHSVTDVRFGRVSQRLKSIGYNTWREAVNAEIDNWAGKAEGLYTSDELSLIREVTDMMGPLFGAVTTPRLVHADIWAGNVLVGRPNGAPSVAAIIDADRAIFGDPMMEFGLGWMNHEAIYAGYGTTPPAPDTPEGLRRRYYALLFNLLDSYVWARQYNDPAEYRQTHDEAVTRAQALKNDLND